MSSGLFLQKLSLILNSAGYSVLCGTIRSDDTTLLLNYSVGLFCVCKDFESGKRLSDVLNKDFEIKLVVCVPDRWVSAEFTLDKDQFHVSYLGTTTSFNPIKSKLCLSSLDGINLNEKTENKYTTAARSWIGNLNYLSNANPMLTFYVSYLSSTLHFDPEMCANIAESLVSASNTFLFSMIYTVKFPNFVAIYSDASHTLKTCRSHSGFLIQLQSSENPDPMNNVFLFGSEKLTKLYNNVYSAELKALSNALKFFLLIKSNLCKVYKKNCNCRFLR